MNYIEKQNSQRIQSIWVTINLKTVNVSLIISSDLLHFNFTKSRYKTLETMNVSNLRRNKVDNALASYRHFSNLTSPLINAD